MVMGPWLLSRERLSHQTGLKSGCWETTTRWIIPANLTDPRCGHPESGRLGINNNDAIAPFMQVKTGGEAYILVARSTWYK